MKVVVQVHRHRDSVDREDSLFASYKCPLTNDLLYEPVGGWRFARPIIGTCDKFLRS
jgi:hypothetical protein